MTIIHDPTVSAKPLSGSPYAVRDDKDKPDRCESTPMAESLLDDLSSDPPKTFHSIAHLISEKNRISESELRRFKRIVQEVTSYKTLTLIGRLETTTDPLLLWATHRALDKRDIEPCLRWPATIESDQVKFVVILADLLWFARRNPEHKPLFKGWKRLFTEVPGSAAWQDRCYWLLKAFACVNLSRYGSKALALSHAHRQQLMMFPTMKMYYARTKLQPTPFEATRQQLLSHAYAHPDKAGKYSPYQVANRRTSLWRVSVLSGHSPNVTRDNWEKLTGESLSRQTISRQISAIKVALEDET